ncbi:MAG: type II toxin-antitoxin system Phd/YefM family antitoxin [Deltaproteobacteria bacterium]|nr:type II toxin-antitoxin system Phd/YefM family antitoxin [Deltaproteobacteria bacterium]MBW1863167.1 type II toxin-antitoxin system Phd/YefM family antitoxin [Deltaproteobacteria bacterium]
MKLSENIKPISFFKAHAAEIIKKLSRDEGVMIITQNGEAKAVVQDIHTFERTQESLAMLRILAQSKKSLEKGKARPADEVLKDLANNLRGASKK